MRQAVRPGAKLPATIPAAFAANRAVGSVELDVRCTDSVTRRHVVRESGSLRVRFPSPETSALSAVLLNTAGGIAGGDRFAVSVRAGPDSRVVVTTASAEKIYRSHGPAARLDVTLSATDRARIAWLPQETILFDRAALARRIDIDLAATASLLCAEVVVFGRTAMDERLREGSFVDRWNLRRDGKLVFAETTRLDGDIGAKLARRVVANGGIAVATVLIVPGDDGLAARVRQRACSFRSEFGISAWNGFALARFCGADAAQLRADVMGLLTIVDSAALPRLWLN
jgi:urease accessory protein